MPAATHAFALHGKTVVLAHVMFLERLQPAICRIILHNGTTSIVRLQFQSATECNEFYDQLTVALTAYTPL